MITKEIYPAGSFDQWNETTLSRFRGSEYSTNVGEQLVFENDKFIVWSIKLEPNESLPFHKHTRNYYWTALNSGSAISCYETGSVFKYDYMKGDGLYYDHDSNGDFVHCLFNIGVTVLEFVTVEYK